MYSLWNEVTARSAYGICFFWYQWAAEAYLFQYCGVHKHSAVRTMREYRSVMILLLHIIYWNKIIEIFAVTQCWQVRPLCTLNSSINNPTGSIKTFCCLYMSYYIWLYISNKTHHVLKLLWGITITLKSTTFYTAVVLITVCLNNITAFTSIVIIVIQFLLRFS